MITLYNTLSRKKEEFKPMNDGQINMYVCGPTVYDVPHIGHARSALVFDVIRRYMEYAEYEVLMVRNVTDVDDKIINKAILELKEAGEDLSGGKLKDKTKDVAERYLRIYHEQLESLGIRPPVKEPKATETIDLMIKFIETLIEKGHAYTSGSNVYFSVESFPEYGKLSHQDKDQMLHGTRKDIDANKKSPLDFALWKEAKPDEPSWPSPWGEGRPGWHIECSVMSTDLLGASFDIHGGGLDLIFPHHENEIAQAEAATGRPFANYWIHNGLLSVNGEKMSKSLGNYITITDFLEKYKDPDLLKISFLWSHYHSPMDYSDEKIEEARRSKERILIFFDKVDRLCAASSGEELEDGEVRIDELDNKFKEVMNDDFNTPQALSVIFEAVKTGNDILADEAKSDEEKAKTLSLIKDKILKFGDVLSLSLRPVEVADEIKEDIDELVQKRQDARKNKDFAEADRIRDELASKGIVVEDTPKGPVWRKI